MRETMRQLSFMAALMGAISMSGCSMLPVIGGKETRPIAVAPALAATDPLAGEGWQRASFLDAAGAMSGAAAVRNAGEGSLIRIDIRGLTPGWHGVHIHMTGNCSDAADGFKASGGHLDPAGMEHGFAHPGGFEAGDLPNLYAGADGRAVAEFYRSGLSTAMLIDQDGAAVVVHAGPDDHETQPIGGAGARVACAAFGR
jgi:Cu-Zn family superoxide dismutase